MNKTGAKRRLVEPGLHLYQNKRNEHKYIEVAVYKNDRHYYYKQFMHWDNGVTNVIGDKVNKYRRIRRSSLSEVLEDYTELPIDYSMLP